MKNVLLGTLVTAAFAAAAPLALAQTADGNADATIVAQAAQQPGSGAARVERHAPGKRAFRAPSERVEARLAYAKTALKITDAQQPQWDSFANVLRKHARAMDQRFEARRAQWEAARAQTPESRQSGAAGGRAGQVAQRPNVNAIESLERNQQRMAERSARLSEVIAAAKPLYAAFSPEQKQIADGMLAHQGRGGQRQHHRGMHRGA